MAIKDSLLPEFDHEMATTRRVLERVPEGEFEWRPHDKSMTLRQLAGHIANMPAWCGITLEVDVLDLDALGGDARLQQAQSRDGMLKHFDERRENARALLAAQTDPAMMARWTLKKGGHEIFTLPRVTAIRSFVMNHMIHHRGQLTVYLRLKNVPVPPIYGPSADEA